MGQIDREVEGMILPASISENEGLEVQVEETYFEGHVLLQIANLEQRRERVTW